METPAISTTSNFAVNLPLTENIKHEQPLPESSSPTLFQEESEPEEEEEEVEEEEEEEEEEDEEEEEEEEEEEVEDPAEDETEDLPVVHQHQKPQFLESIDKLNSFANAIHNFKTCFDQVQNHLDFIGNALDAHSNGLALSPSNQQQESGYQTHTELIAKPEAHTISQTDSKAKPETEAAHTAMKQKESKYEIIAFCQRMCSRELRKYIVTHLSDTVKLREEVPAALKYASRPARLVLDCVGRFYLQGTKAYSTNSPMIPARKGAILIMEYFLLMVDDKVEIDQALKDEAQTGAVAWRKRLISEGGLSRAPEVDARGLLLYLACFGFPSMFKDEDIWTLINLSNLKKIGDALRRSRVLVSKISGIIEGMMKKGMTIEAVEVASVLKIDDKFPPVQLLTSFLHESKEAYKKSRRDANSSLLLKEANEKQMAALKSVLKCLKDYNMDPIKILPGWQIKEKIVNLEKENADLKQKIESEAKAKRKANANELMNNFRNQEAKRSRFTTMQSPIISTLAPDQRGVVHLDSKSSYDAIMPRSSLHDNLGSYPVPLHENGLGARVASGISPGYGHLSGLYPGTHTRVDIDGGGSVLSSNNGSSLYASWHHGVGESTLVERSIGQSLARQHVGIGDFPASRSSFVGQLNSSSGTGIANPSDLYSFADVVDGNPRPPGFSQTVHQRPYML